MLIYSATARPCFSQDGFTLIESVIALAILSIAIFGIASMQTVGIQGNATANRISESSNWAANQTEQIFAWQYDDSRLLDVRTGSLDNNENPDHGPLVQGNYSIVWNVQDSKPIPNEMTKMIRVIVTRKDQDSSKRVSFDYIKMKYMN